MIARIILIAFAFASVAWGVFSFGISREAGPVERIGKRVIYGEAFGEGVLDVLQPAMTSIEAAEDCQPNAQRAVAIIRLRKLESAVLAAARKSIDDNRIALRNSIIRSLGCAPADPYLWLILYWTDITQNGLNPRHFDYLRMSYQTGPNEAWVALKRNRLVLAAFSKLPPDLATLAGNEFVGLLATRRAYPDAVRTMRGLDVPARNFVLPKLASLPDDIRRDFSRALYRAGMNVEVPGIPPLDPRPWR
jgi:hypothetical protein